MLNQVIIVGRITKDLEVKELDDGKKVCNIELAVPRSFKNANGEYDTDYIDVVLWNMIAQNTSEYCHKGDLVGVKGRLETGSIANDDGEKIAKTTTVVAEKLTFLSTKNPNDKEEE